MNAREMELIKFCEEQKVDEEISKKFREASEKEAEELAKKYGMEKEEFIKTGKIYLSVMGNIQPPVALYIDRPYIRQ